MTNNEDLKDADPGVLGIEAVAPAANFAAHLERKASSALNPAHKEIAAQFEKDPIAFMKANREKMNDPYRMLYAVASPSTVARLVLFVTLLRFLSRAGGRAVSLATLGAVVGSMVYKIRARPPANPNHPNAPKALPIVGHLFLMLEYKESFHQLVRKCLKDTDFGPLTWSLPGPQDMVFIRHARDYEHILRRNFRNYPNNVPSKDLGSTECQGAELAGRGIFMTDGPEWSFHRKRASHMFSVNELQNKMEKVFAAHSAKFSMVLEKLAEENRVTNIQDLIASVIFDTFCDIAFSAQTEQMDELLRTGQKPEFLAAFDNLQGLTMDRFAMPPAVWHVMRMLNIGYEAKLAESARIVNEYVIPIVRKRLASRKADQAAGEDAPQDLLSLYLQGEEDTDEDTLRDIIINFMIAGRDTTSSTLTSAFRYMSENPESREKLRAAFLNERQGKVHEDLSWAEAKGFVYPNAFFNETIRMSPPVPSFPRSALEEDVLPSGTVIKPGDAVFIPMQVLGRRPELWKDPDSFKPERWMVHGEKTPVRRPDEYVFPVFWGGYRLCLGKDMARMEALVFLKSVIVDHDIEVKLEPGQDLETLQNGPVHFIKGGVNVRAFSKTSKSQ